METDLRAAELAEIERQLDGLCERLDARLHGLEAYRALGQLTAREAQGRPLEAMAAGELRTHLERELNADPFYRLLTKLGEARAALKPQVAAPSIVPTPVPKATAPPFAPPLSVAAPQPNSAVATVPLPVEPELPAAKTAGVPQTPAAPVWDAGNLQAAALAAVASAFGNAKVPPAGPAAKAAEPVAVPVPAEPPPPIADPGPATEARAKSAERIWLPLSAPRAVLFGPAAAPEKPIAETSKPVAKLPVAELVPAKAQPSAPVADENRTRQPLASANGSRVGVGDTTAETTVLATLAKLRSPAVTQPLAPPVTQLAIDTDLRIDNFAGPKLPRVSMEGTMANVAAAVAATVAAAERISGPQSTWTTRPAALNLPPPGSPAAQIFIPERPAENVALVPPAARAPASGTLFRDRSKEAPPPRSACGA